MNILMIGSGKGVWEIRGKQLGAVLGARVVEAPSRDDFAWASVVVLIKRASVAYAQQAQARGVPVVWDPVDAWSQPAQNTLSETEATAWLQREIAARRPMLTMGATQAMAAAAGGGGVYLPHHHLVGLQAAPVRERIELVVYDGRPEYLGRWARALDEACRARGWRFAINPPDLSQADLFVAFRDGPWDGYMPREWKSGVKVLNAIAAGRPILSQDMASMREIRPFGHTRVEFMADLDEALDAWRDPDTRQAVADWCRDEVSRYTVQAVARQYQQILEAVACPA